MQHNDRQGRDNPRSRPADRARLARLAVVGLVIVAALVLARLYI